MQHFHRIFFADDASMNMNMNMNRNPDKANEIDDMNTMDDIDTLFQKLQPVEPPPLLIQRILTEVLRLAQAEKPTLWDELDNEEGNGPIVRNDTRPPN